MHHWDYPTLNATNIDDITTYITYYPMWKEKTTGAGPVAAPAKIQSIDQVDWM
jgi:hypothetical protein